MNQKIVECVPNFSEGRDLKKIDAIVAAIKTVTGAEVLDVDPGAETNRTVVTIVGSPEVVAEAAFVAVQRAAELIDMTTHSGAHARHGATDVCPFIPVKNVTMAECVEIAKKVGERIGKELGIPVYLYDQAAQIPERRSLAKVRAGEYEALPEKMKQAAWKPDFGPQAFNAKSGVVTVGAREFLIAYNINLNSQRKDHAADIATEIRETGRAVRRNFKTGYYHSGSLQKYRPSKNIWPCAYCETDHPSYDALSSHYEAEHDLDLAKDLAFFDRDPKKLEGLNVMKRGTFKECRGVGWVIPEYNRAQISLNLTNYKITPIHIVLDESRRLATARGLQVTGSEVVGLIPYPALEESGFYYLKKQGSSRGLPQVDVIETAVQSMGFRDVAEFDAEQSVLGLPSTAGELSSMSICDFADEVSRPTPAPGGGSVAAMAGSTAAALTSMVANLSFGKKKLAAVHEEMESVAMRAQVLKDDLLRAIDADTDAFNDVLVAMRMAKDEPGRAKAIQDGYKKATSVPYNTALLALETIELAKIAAAKGLAASVTDAGVAAMMGRTAVIGAVYNVKINLGSIDDAEWVAKTAVELDSMIEKAEGLEAEVRAIIESSF